MKHLIILYRVLLCAMLLFRSLAASAQTAPVAEAVPDTITLSTTDFAIPTLPKGAVYENVLFPLALVVIFVLFIVYLSIVFRKVPNREQMRGKAYEKTDKEPRQIKLTITCDEGYTADFLRELATVIEDRDEDDFDFEYETFRGCAEMTTED